MAHKDTLVLASLATAAVCVLDDLVVFVADVDVSVFAVVVLERVGFFAVDGKVTFSELVLGHTQGDTADVLDENHDQRSPDDVPADDEQSTDDL